MTGVLNGEETRRHIGVGHVRWGRIGVMQPHAKGYQRPLAATGSWERGRGRKDPPLGPSEGAWLWIAAFWLPELPLPPR